MSQTYFRKLEGSEKSTRLVQLGSSRVRVTIWIKGDKTKHQIPVLEIDKDKNTILIDAQVELFPADSAVLVSFDIRGMSFFAQARYTLHGDHSKLAVTELFKSERRSSYRLLTYPVLEIWARFDLGESYQGGNVIDMNSRSSQTKMFQNFLKIADGGPERTDAQNPGELKIRLQDLSATGMAIHIGEIEAQHFVKDRIFENVCIEFRDEDIVIPEVKVMYVVDYISSDKRIKKYKVGCHFPNLNAHIDEQLAKKINSLLRESDKDFETFLK